ncbi:hypothetical protein PX699_23100 [Sphingobium sp. H39-3-25]|uniref:deazapurine DNA modification protein DpdA family protein n=1 Tax=Sphingobium arseniciresistens TaxID=3030834 RepID=UPI0023B9177A|nr:hypothetical protein [Sphingobium arseniciresistens]
MPHDIPFRFQQPPVSSALSQAGQSSAHSSKAAPRLAEGIPIEIIVGLPGLSEGPLLVRARALQLPVLISANSLSRWRQRDGGREWFGWRLRQLANAHGLASIMLDSAGFVLASKYRGIPWTVQDYVEGLAAAYPWRLWASLDHCVEPEIARDREEVLDRIARTVRLNIECHARAADAGIVSNFMPVLQGRRPSDYLRCLDGIANILRPGQTVAIGSTCRRAVHGEEGLLAVFETLDRHLDPTFRIHGFGIKGPALSHLRAFDHRTITVDSSAFSYAARMSALFNGHAKTNHFVADHMERWTERQYLRLARPRSGLQSSLPLSPPAGPLLTGWEAAIAAAREEIRTLVIEGEIDHDEVMIGWIEQWAADLDHAA